MPVAALPMSRSSVHGSLQIPSAVLSSRCPRSCRQHRRVLRVQAAKTADGPSVAIVGVTGAVGQEFLRASCPVSKVEVADEKPCLLCCAPDLLCAVHLTYCVLCIIPAVRKKQQEPYITAGYQREGFSIFQLEDACFWQVFLTICHMLHL